MTGHAFYKDRWVNINPDKLATYQHMFQWNPGSKVFCGPADICEGHAVAGALLQALYFGGVWLAMGKGVGAGVTALIVCLQPAVTGALVGRLLG